MKKMIALILSVTLIASLSGCGAANDNSADSDNVSSVAVNYDKPYYSSKDEVSKEKIIERTTPSKIIEETGGIKCDIKYVGFTDETYDGATAYDAYKKIGDVIHINMYFESPNGLDSMIYLNDDANDEYMYIRSGSSYSASPYENSEVVDYYTNISVVGLSSDNAEIKEIKEENGKYVVSVDISEYEQQEMITIDPTTGLVEKAVVPYISKQGEEVSEERTYTYTSDIEIDMTPKTNDDASEDDQSNEKISFTSTDINGNPVSMDDFKDAKLVMINFWEPWCGPCVEEMPELQKLYDNYKDKGFMILGVTADTTVEDDAKAIVEDLGIEYPIIHGNEEISSPTLVFPTTIFTDGNGNVISSEPMMGSNNYDGWETIIKSYLD